MCDCLLLPFGLAVSSAVEGFLSFSREKVQEDTAKEAEFQAALVSGNTQKDSRATFAVPPFQLLVSVPRLAHRLCNRFEDVA